jgi:hypothetical protein
MLNELHHLLLLVVSYDCTLPLLCCCHTLCLLCSRCVGTLREGRRCDESPRR